VQTTFKPLTKAQRAELQGYVAWYIWLFRALAFVIVLAFTARLLQVIQRGVAGGDPVFGHPAWWIVPVAALGAALYRVSGRWTGGRKLRSAIRRDLARGEAAMHRVTAVEAIEVEEAEDEGPSFFIRTGEGRTMVFAGQYLDRLKSRGFPWTAFDIVEAPESKMFFAITRVGEPLPPSMRRPPLPFEESKQYGVLRGRFLELDMDFAELKSRLTGGGGS
jgi:hypothetical protein